ncbi:MAG TPA: DUF58 domain-containing protein [Vicinamibacterales bacterium]|nr:DUF58 domain-containing protein [Vicinamibacterales bacterium]
MILRPLMPETASSPAVATRRFPYGFGPRFFVLLGAGLILTIPVWIDPRVIVALVAWNAVVLTVWVFDVRQIPMNDRIHISRRWTAPLALGARSRVALEVDNRAAIALRVDAIDDVPASFSGELPQAGVEVGPRERAQVEYEIAPRERGDVRLGSISLRVRSSWAIGERWLTAAAAQTVRVFPDLDEARRQSMFLLRSRQVALEKRRARVIGLGRDFESLRDYQPGDERRDICWTVTARRARPVTKIYQPERSQAVWILVDGGRLLRARIGERTKLDGMVNAALGLAEVALAAGDRVGLLTYGRRTHTRLAPGRGGQHLRLIVDALATVPAERAEADHAAAAAALMAIQKQRALIVWLTDVAETAGVPDVIESAARLSPQHLLLFGVLEPSELIEAAGAAPAREEDMYRMLAAQEMLDRREVLLKTLRQRGVHVLEMDPSGPTALLIDRYLSVKERNLV